MAIDLKTAIEKALDATYELYIKDTFKNTQTALNGRQYNVLTETLINDMWMSLQNSTLHPVSFATAMMIGVEVQYKILKETSAKELVSEDFIKMSFWRNLVVELTEHKRNYSEKIFVEKVDKIIAERFGENLQK